MLSFDLHSKTPIIEQIHDKANHLLDTFDSFFNTHKAEVEITETGKQIPISHLKLSTGTSFHPVTKSGTYVYVLLGRLRIHLDEALDQDRIISFLIPFLGYTVQSPSFQFPCMEILYAFFMECFFMKKANFPSPYRLNTVVKSFANLKGTPFFEEILSKPIKFQETIDDLALPTGPLRYENLVLFFVGTVLEVSEAHQRQIAYICESCSGYDNYYPVTDFIEKGKLLCTYAFADYPQLKQELIQFLHLCGVKHLEDFGVDLSGLKPLSLDLVDPDNAYSASITTTPIVTLPKTPVLFSATEPATPATKIPGVTTHLFFKVRRTEKEETAWERSPSSRR